MQSAKIPHLGYLHPRNNLINIQGTLPEEMKISVLKDPLGKWILPYLPHRIFIENLEIIYGSQILKDKFYLDINDLSFTIRMIFLCCTINILLKFSLRNKQSTSEGLNCFGLLLNESEIN